MQWIQHHHYLLRNNGTNQNFVEVERDFHDLSAAMEDLFRERYLTQAAEACYWRRLIRRWKDVQGFEPVLYMAEAGGAKGKNEKSRVKREQKRGVRFETFM
jgi:hypothetical protein